MDSVSVSEAQANLKTLIERVVAEGVPIMIRRARGESVVLVSQSEWDGMAETLHLLKSPKNAEQLLEAIEGLNCGEGVERALTPFPAGSSRGG